MATGRHASACSAAILGAWRLKPRVPKGLDAAWTWVAGETRTCVTIIAEDSETTVINEPGAAVTLDDWNRFLAQVAESMECANAVCISGSLPLGVPEDGLAWLIESAKVARKPVWVDTSSGALRDAVGARATGIKINAAEASALMSRNVRTVSQAIAVAIEIRSGGVGVGVVVVCNDGAWRARPPNIDVVSPVGSGDCCLAGLMVGLQEEHRPGEALSLAVAAGAANALQFSTGVMDEADLERIRAEIRLEALSSSA